MLDLGFARSASPACAKPTDLYALGKSFQMASLNGRCTRQSQCFDAVRVSLSNFGRLDGRHLRDRVLDSGRTRGKPLLANFFDSLTARAIMAS